MTPRERWLALCEGRKPARPVCDYWGTGEVTARLKSELGCPIDRALWERLGVDKLIHLGPPHPRAAERDWHLQSLFSVWNIGTVDVPQEHGGGTYRESVSFPLAGAECVADVESWNWPDPEEWDVEALEDEIESWAGYPILCGSSEPFYLYCRLRGMELALEDLGARPELADAILERIFYVDQGLFRRILEAFPGKIDFVYVAEDLGTQESLLLSPAMWRKFLKPRMSMLIALAHSYGVRAFHHDDGSVRKLLPELLEAGIDLLNPIQWKCRGMERESLAAEFGPSVIFHGGVDNQHTLPFGTPDDVRAEVRDNLRIFADCRYIVAPCHNIQPNTPTENILALYDEARRATSL